MIGNIEIERFIFRRLEKGDDLLIGNISIMNIDKQILALKLDIESVENTEVGHTI